MGRMRGFVLVWIRRMERGNCNDTVVVVVSLLGDDIRIQSGNGRRSVAGDGGRCSNKLVIIGVAVTVRDRAVAVRHHRVRERRRRGVRRRRDAGDVSDVAASVRLLLLLRCEVRARREEAARRCSLLKPRNRRRRARCHS